MEQVSKKIKNEIIKKGISVIKSGKHEYPITYQIIKDGRKNKILSKKIRSSIFVSMFHGKNDEVVPSLFSKKSFISIYWSKKKN